MLYGIAECYRNAVARCACIRKYFIGRSEIINFHRIIIDLCKSVSPVQPENAELPILVTLSGIVMLVSPVQL